MRTRNYEEENEKTHIIWIDDPRKYPYVRESTYEGSSPNRKPFTKRTEKIDGWKLVGYEKLQRQDDIISRWYIGRYWWLKRHDKSMPDEATSGGYGHRNEKGEYYDDAPCEAVKFI